MDDILVRARLIGKQVVETVFKEVVHGILLTSLELGQFRKAGGDVHPQGRPSTSSTKTTANIGDSPGER